MRWITNSIRWLPMAMLLVLASACSHGGGVKPAPIPCPPAAVVRAPCLKTAPPRPPSIETLSRLPPADLESFLWRRIELLELWSSKAWASCGTDTPGGTTR